MRPQIQAVMDKLQANQMQPFFVARKEDVVPLVRQFVQAGDTVSAGGSTSLFESGVIRFIEDGPYRFLNRYAPGLSDADIRDIYTDTARADVYFCSCNAVTEQGELYNVDGNANRISAIAYGPKSVVMVVGVNKIVPDLDAAVARVKTLVAPAICRRSDRDTFCSRTGQCVSLSGAAGMAAGCDSPDRACCSFLVTGRQRLPGRIKVVLVDEALGL